MAVVGKRTSVYLSDDLAAAVEASGVPLGELVRRGLAAAGMTLEAGPGALILQGAAQDGAAGDCSARDAFPRAAGAAPTRGAQPPGRRRCPHPGTRVIGGWCRQCDAMVEPGGYLPSPNT